MTKPYTKMTINELKEEIDACKIAYNGMMAKNLSLDMTRGKPSTEQLDAVSDLVTILSKDDVCAEGGIDTRNYGGLTGITEARRIFSWILGCSYEKVIVWNNSSLNLMHDALMRALLIGEIDSSVPWSKIEKRRWLCPVPGYDRHFHLIERLGFELIAVPLTPDGPDMDIVEDLVKKDASILGMWAIPMYSNPDGYAYSHTTCQRLVSMETAAKDFRIYWDNAYAVHHLYPNDKAELPDILDLCESAGHANRVYAFASMSKITFAGAGLACMATNQANMAHTLAHLSIVSIGPDKLNQLRHARFLPNPFALDAVMQQHADLIRPKFDKTNTVLHAKLDSLGIATWHEPKGGYFISLFVYPQTAKRIVSLCKAIGVALTPAGATYPYGQDPDDANIRIAPTFPSIDDVSIALEALCVCIRLAACEKMLEEKEK